MLVLLRALTQGLGGARGVKFDARAGHGIAGQSLEVLREFVDDLWISNHTLAHSLIGIDQRFNPGRFHAFGHGWRRGRRSGWRGRRWLRVRGHHLGFC